MYKKIAATKGEEVKKRLAEWNSKPMSAKIPKGEN